ncbi:early nodulin-like protein 1 [Amborella trichopoda]|uniref:early nodulin-like protein 1 n=1 Tax=Amborella trichopoda TaxID=13333 RepID=UPI0009C11F3B|nr:early nodulin-like protein 1 [Amborella trichopoda]|eukprot:XP_020527730.1 early nodulin-like protein 1 [Amborella trichopoda]
MASLSSCLCNFSLLFFLCFSLSQASMQHKLDWAIPNSNGTDYFNYWASHNRFQIDDTINFKYTRDSVMVVNSTDYKQCNYSKPIMYFNDGATNFKLDRSGDFYFISGTKGHCQRGQRMIVRVMSHPVTPSPSATPPGPPAPPVLPSPSLASTVATASSFASVALVVFSCGFVFFYSM